MNLKQVLVLRFDHDIIVRLERFAKRGLRWDLPFAPSCVHGTAIVQRSRELPGNIEVGNVQGTSQLTARSRVKGRWVTD